MTTIWPPLEVPEAAGGAEREYCNHKNDHNVIMSILKIFCFVFSYIFRRLNFSDTSSEGPQRDDRSINSTPGLGGIPGSPAMSSCSDGEPPHSPIENYHSPNRSRSPIISSSGVHSSTTQSDVESLRALLQEVFSIIPTINLCRKIIAKCFTELLFFISKILIDCITNIYLCCILYYYSLHFHWILNSYMYLFLLYAFYVV